MKFLHGIVLVLLFTTPHTTVAQVAPRDVNGYRNSQAGGTSMDTNVSFSLRMTLAGDDTLRLNAELGQDVSIRAVIRPEAGDVGQAADITIVDYIPPIPYRRDLDGNFVPWNGSLRTLEPSQEGVILTEALDVEVFSGQLGSTGDHRIFIAFRVGGTLYFTPTALRISITAPAPTAREQAISLFESAISSPIVQGRCVTCHRSGGAAAGQSVHQFVFSSNPDHLTINFEQFENLHTVMGTSYILNKVRGMLGHGGGVQLTTGSTDYNNLSDFLDLLDQASP